MVLEQVTVGWVVHGGIVYEVALYVKSFGQDTRQDVE